MRTKEYRNSGAWLLAVFLFLSAFSLTGTSAVSSLQERKSPTTEWVSTEKDRARSNAIRLEVGRANHVPVPASNTPLFVSLCYDTRVATALKTADIIACRNIISRFTPQKSPPVDDDLVFSSLG